MFTSKCPAWTIATLLSSFFALTQPTSSKTLKNGLFTINSCDAHTAEVASALNTLQVTLQPAIADTYYGASSPPFKAFFKNSLYGPFVGDILRNASTGTPIPKQNIIGNAATSPQIICVTNPGQVAIFGYHGEYSDMYLVCQELPGMAAYYENSTTWIFLCPNFFILPKEPEESWCPYVEDGRFVGSAQRMVQRQPLALLHELVHYYLGSSPITQDRWLNASGWNEAFDLTALGAVSNAQSYSYYVAMIAANCTAFPNATSISPTTSGRNCRGRCLDGPVFGSDNLQTQNLTVERTNSVNNITLVAANDFVS